MPDPFCMMDRIVSINNAVAERKLGPGRKMLFHRSIDEFIAEFDSDRSASSESLKAALISNNLSGFNLWEWLNKNLLEIVGDDDFDGIKWADG
ncbi:MAG: hypothetical protein J2P31_01260 [Blastocatellia bacterium]|nr:hypothetical protein [Blastocatellia bacterium]